MPAHAVAGHLVVIVAPLAALLALTYAAMPRARRGLRWPLLAVVGLAVALVVWAGEAGGTLRDQLRTAAGDKLPTAVDQHAHGSDSLALTVFLLATSALVFVWWVLRPGRTGTGATVAAWALGLSGSAVLVTTGTVLTQAMRAVWATQEMWTR